MDNNIINKIQKLLNIANGGTPNEQKVAMIKAQKLMLEYRIEFADLNGVEVEQVVELACDETVNRYVSCIDMLANTICKNFRCIPLYFRPQWRKGKYTEVSVCGLQNDAEICKSVLEYAVKVAEMDCKRIINKMRYEGHSTKNYKNTFMDGFNKGLIEGFYQQIIQDNRYALVVVIPKEVKDHVSTKGNIDLPFNSTESAADEVIKAHGYRRGMEFVDALNNSKKLDERLKIVE